MRNYVLLLLLVLSSGCDDPTKEKEVPPLEQPAFVFRDILTWYSEDAERRLRLKAPTQLVFETEDVYYPDGLEVTMYQANGGLGTTLTADSGRHIKKDNLFKAMGNVRVLNHEKQQSFRSQTLNWDQRKHEIFTEDSIEIITPTERLTGIGMTSDESFEHYKIWRPLGTFLIRSGGTPVPDSLRRGDTTRAAEPSFDSLMRKYRQRETKKAPLQPRGQNESMKSMMERIKQDRREKNSENRLLP